MAYLYAVRMMIPGYPFSPVKVGVSENPDRRVMTYNSGPFPVEWLGSWERPNAYASEQRIHRRFRDYRLAGEWFYPTPELMTLIKEKATPAPQRRNPGFQRRFLRLFPWPNSLTNELESPGLAQPCSKADLKIAFEMMDEHCAAN